MAAAVIGRDDELGTIQAFLADVDRGPVSARPLGRGGDRQDDALGSRRRSRDESIRPCADVPRRRSGSIAVVRRALGAALTGLRGCRGVTVAAATAGAGDCAPPRRARRRGAGCPRDRPGGARRAACSDRARASSRRLRRLAVARSRIRRRRADRTAPAARRADSTARDCQARRRTWRAPSSSTAPSPRRVSSQLSLGPLSLGAVHALLEERVGLELTRPELARVWEATGGNAFFALELGRELVRTDTRPAPGQALRIPESLQELLGGRLGRLPTDTGDVLLQVASLARPTVDWSWRGRTEIRRGCSRRWRQPRVRVSSSSTVRMLASRTRCSRRSVTSRRRSGSAAPSIAHWPEWSRTWRNRPAISRWRRTGPTLSSPPTWRPLPSRRRRAVPPWRQPSSTSSQPSSRRTIPPLRGTGASGSARCRRLAGDEVEGRDGTGAAAWPRFRTGVERADLLFELASTLSHRAAHVDRTPGRGAGGGRRGRRPARADPGLPGLDPRLPGRHQHRAAGRQGSAGEGRAGR